MKVAVIGTTGYGGVELLRILQRHSVFHIQSIHSSRGEAPIWEEYPHLYQLNNQTLETIEPEKIAAEADLVFLATPSGVSGQLAAQFAGMDIKVIDLSGDLRLKNQDDYVKWYKREAAPQHAIDKAVYGLSEWNREQIAGADWISNPGCYATSALLGLAPVVKEKLINPAAIIVDAKSGTSGAGRKPTRMNMYAEMSENFQIYKVNEHQHIPEIEQQLMEWNEDIKPITFSTHLLPISRGIMATIYVQLQKELNIAQLNQLYQEHYQNAPFVRVYPEGHYPSIKGVSGSNYCDIGLHLDVRTGRLTIVSVIDNLMKGAAGQAVQNANIMYGLDETTGIDFIPMYP
ncbi:N-acetyl-gamma-glutamyl-phosphate reductase [Bacillus benzoevorans]|uniref:N-acetyl-gamma-glutamyl-phosphate reductase n=1 Tax=Bacillus benzoevorans TaxID=1456 RepID=A0A7X0HMG7_9BACI|nr:N-acetyl-gamma-glutamyl-phosphate reductase [Bacillus benzoevorans]MBB6443528.1 N-acetyl-gamma-glutamyl-phosphate reductase [Bacillus benzoevorans]